MKRIFAAVLPPGTPAPEGAQLVVFADAKPYISEALAAQALAYAARYAQKYGVWVLSRRFLAAGALCLCLISPEGKAVGAQQATHLGLDYRSLRLTRADRVEVFDTELGRIALLPDADMQMPHVVRSAVLQGAELLIGSEFIQPYDFFEDRVALCVASAVGSNGVPMVAALGSRGVILSPGEEPLVSPFDESMVFGPVTPRAMPESMRAQTEEAAKIIAEHSAALCSAGGDSDVE